MSQLIENNSVGFGLTHIPITSFSLLNISVKIGKSVVTYGYYLKQGQALAQSDYVLSKHNASHIEMTLLGMVNKNRSGNLYAHEVVQQPRAAGWDSEWEAKHR